MKIAITYNSRDGVVYARRGPQTREWLRPERPGQVAEVLRNMGHDAVAIEADLHVMDHLRDLFGPTKNDRIPGFVFNLAYGLQGHVRYAQMPGILEMLGLPYLGSGPLGHAVAYDKPTAKRILSSWGLPTPDFQVYNSSEYHPEDGTKSESAGKPMGFPVIVKPSAEAASEGLVKVQTLAELPSAVRHEWLNFHEPVLVEQFIKGREINVSVLGNNPVYALPPVEVRMTNIADNIYDANAKKGQGNGSVEMICPADISDELTSRAQKLATQAFAVLQCRDWARVDMRLDDEGELKLLEVNTIPGLASNSSFSTAARAAGIAAFDGLIGRLLDIALARYEASE